MKQQNQWAIFGLAFVLLSSLLVLVNVLAVPEYPAPVLLELPPISGETAVSQKKEPAKAEETQQKDATPAGSQQAVIQQTDVPTQEVETEEPAAAETEEKTYSFPVSINSASREELVYVKGIGEKTADKILNYLAQNGPVSSIDELKKIKGIGPKTVEKLSEYFYAP